MRVLHIYKTYFPDTQGGMEEFLRQLCLATTRLGAGNTIITLSPHVRGLDILERPEARVMRFPMLGEVASSPFGLRLLRDFGDLIDKHDIVHQPFPWPFGDVLNLLHNRNKKPLVISYVSDIVRQRRLKWVYRPLMNALLARANQILVPSANYLVSSADLAPYQHKCRVVPIGIDEESYPAVDVERLNYWRSHVGEKFFLFVGVLRYYKGLRCLLDAIRNTSHKVVIVGTGPLDRELRRLVVERQMGNVSFLGFVPDRDKVALFTLAQAVVLPSHLRAEAYGMTLVEGAMYGRPLISTNLGTGTSFINAHGLTGLVVQPDDPVELRHAMDQIAARPDASVRMGQASRRRFEELFQAETMGRRYAEVMTNLSTDERAAV